MQQFVTQMKKQSILDEETFIDAKYQIAKDLQQIKESNPDKKGILTHTETAKTLVERVTVAGGLVMALPDAAEVIRKVF